MVDYEARHEVVCLVVLHARPREVALQYSDEAPTAVIASRAMPRWLPSVFTPLRVLAASRPTRLLLVCFGWQHEWDWDVGSHFIEDACLVTRDGTQLVLRDCGP